MPFKISMSDVKGIPDPGMYLLRLDDIKLVEKTDDNGDDGSYLNERYQVMEPEEWVGCPPIWNIHSLKPQSRYFLKVWLEALTQQEFNEDDMEIDENELVNLFVQASIIHEEYKGQVRAKVKEWFPAS